MNTINKRVLFCLAVSFTKECKAKGQRRDLLVQIKKTGGPFDSFLYGECFSSLMYVMGLLHIPHGPEKNLMVSSFLVIGHL